MSPQETVIANLAFDRAFLDKVKAVETARRKTLHTQMECLRITYLFLKLYAF